jgi:hypothetical protein
VIVGALLGLGLYLIAAVLRARSRVLHMERDWSAERRALRALGKVR